MFFASLLFILILVLGYIFFKYQQIGNFDNKAILILGKGGIGHTGPNLTDTIIVANLNSNSGKTIILSLPRDIWINEIRAKINTAYYYGGFDMAKSSVDSVTGLVTNNVVIIDFSIFKEVIDSLGGIEVNVENTFTDNLYPISGKENDLCGGDPKYLCRYETVTFNSGIQTMDGETALKYVRSRNSLSDEGTDLAREKRQQRVILALKNRITSVDFLTNPTKMKKVYTTIFNNIETDIDANYLMMYLKFLFNSKLNIETVSIPEEMLKVSKNEKKYDYQYVFLPKDGNWKGIQEWIMNKI
jgi:LCP family protein required for cell wall assembly